MFQTNINYNFLDHEVSQDALLLIENFNDMLYLIVHKILNIIDIYKITNCFKAISLIP